jgi:hypothetical protein
MRLKPLYRLRFDYPESWSVELKGEGGTEEQHLLYADGKVEGEVIGRFRGANYARRRTDRTFVTDFRGVIETKDEEAILLECRGFGRRRTPEYDAVSPGARQWVATVLHVSDSAKYRWLNDAVCVGAGQVRPKPIANPTNPTDLVLDVAELLWEPPGP